MPTRQIHFVTGGTYHIYNRGIDHRPTFTNVREFSRARMALRFYRHHDQNVSLSQFFKLPIADRDPYLRRRETFTQLVEILAFCFMPNHFHILARQLADDGISLHLSQFQNSHTRFFNTKHQRSGPLFSTQFKAVKVESQTQLLHLSRYIHLNPYTAGIIEKEGVATYSWSSMPEYIAPETALISQPATILESFSSTEEYAQFVVNRADDQRSLAKIKHAILEEQAS